MLMRRICWFVLIAAVGCESTPPSDFAFEPTALVESVSVYPARTDWLVVQPPATVPPSWNRYGIPPLKSLMLGPVNNPDPKQFEALKSELGKSILNPNDSQQLPLSDRNQVTAAVAQLFGTPWAPQVPDPPQADGREILKLDPSTLQHGAVVYRQWCVSCHGIAGGGDGPAAATLSPPPRDFRSGQFKFISSSPVQAAGKPRRADLARTIRLGLDGSAMPAFPTLSDSDLNNVISYVIHLSLRGESEFQALKRLIVAFEDADPPATEVAAAARKAWKQWLDAESLPMLPPSTSMPVDESAPPASLNIPPDPAQTDADRLASAARGYRLFVDKNGAGCASCHVNFGRTPQLKYDAWGNVIQPRNLLLGLYRGGRRPSDLYARIYAGITASGMPSHRQLADQPGESGADKIWDLVHFVLAAGQPAKRAALREQYGIAWD
jgi:mono/diheme cytochrome c family protein